MPHDDEAETLRCELLAPSAPVARVVNDQTLPAFEAVFASLVLAVVLFVPFVALQYRRRGTLRFGQLVIWGAVLVYSLALLTYTLLPLPAMSATFCARGGAGTQLHPGQVVSDVLRGVSEGQGLVGNAALQQAVFNVVLFVPLGAFVRYLRNTGVITATAVGLGVSLVVELTQLTGDWFIYPCAYRLFDVDDLILDTTGSLLGALLAPVMALVVGRHRDDPGVPRPITVWRRLLGMAGDLVVSLGMGLALAFAYEGAFGRRAVQQSVEVGVLSALVWVVPALVQLVVMLGTQRTLGEAAVRLRPHQPARAHAIVVRWIMGIGGYLLLSPESSRLAGTLALLLLLAVLPTRNHRGIAYCVLGWELVDDRVVSVDDARRSRTH